MSSISTPTLFNFTIFQLLYLVSLIVSLPEIKFTHASRSSMPLCCEEMKFDLITHLPLYAPTMSQSLIYFISVLGCIPHAPINDTLFPCWF